MGKSENNDNPKVKLPPPIVFFGLGIVGVVMEYVVPISIGIDSPLNYLGIGINITSIIAIWKMGELFKKHETEVKPWETTSKIITTGPYKYSRNPIYILFCGIPIGLGIAFNTYWALFAFIPGLIIVYYTAVKKEEKYLETKFGQEYLDYKDKVRRWL